MVQTEQDKRRNLKVKSTDAKVTIDLGDGSLSVPTCDVSASLSVVTYNFTYASEGQYSLAVSAYNFVSNVTKTGTIDIYEPLLDLTLTGDTEILLPPGDGSWVLAAGAAGPYRDVTCVWKMGTNYDPSSSIHTSMNSLSRTKTYAIADVGTQAITVNCSNALSYQNLSMDFEVIWDNVTAGQLTCDSTAFLNLQMTCQLTIVRFGTGACFEWDMGDGQQPVYYRDGACAADVPGSPTYITVIWPNYATYYR